MVEYTTPPKDLSRLNPVQRYMQKGSLEWSDYLRLAAIVLIYWLARPYVQKFFKKASGEDVQEGEAEQAAYQERRAAAAVGANDIRSGKKAQDGRTLGQVLEEGVDGFSDKAKTSGAATAESEDKSTKVKNRKQKKGVSFAAEKSDLDKTMDWEDESEFDPRRKPVEGEEGAVQSGDIKQWMEKWTS